MKVAESLDTRQCIGVGNAGFLGLGPPNPLVAPLPGTLEGAKFRGNFECRRPSENPAVGKSVKKASRLSSVVVMKPFWLQFCVFCSVFLSFCRIGEATNPGPGFVVGAVNPTGLLHKVSQFDLLPERSIWGVSETHITAQGIQHFRRELKLQKSQLKVYHSAYAPRLSNSLGSIGGKASGVAFMSEFPGHNMHHRWPKRLSSEARTHVSAFNIDGVWIRAGVAYGYAKRPNYCETRDRTDELLSLITDRIVHQSHGPRIIIGDFNQEFGRLPQEQVWTQHGFVEVQQVARAKWGQEIAITCKGSSTKDFIWISKELIPFLSGVEVDHHMFADHSVLMAKFQPLGTSIPVDIWQKPVPLPWDKLLGPLPDEAAPDCDDASTTDSARKIFEHMEQQVHRALTSAGKSGLFPIHRGRVRDNPVKQCRAGLCPQKASRQDEFQPGYVGENRMHALWLKQVRRLASLEKLLGSDARTPSKMEHAYALWEAIRSASGFPQGFATFWQNNPHTEADVPSVISHSLPTFVDVEAILKSFTNILRQMEKALQSNRHAVARQRRRDDSTRIFRDVARPRAVPVQTLVSSNVAQVTTVEEDTNTILYQSGALDLQEPVKCPQGFLRIQQHKLGEIVVDCNPGIQEGDLLVQEKLLGTPQEVMASFEELWMGFWGRHANTPSDRWEPFVALCQHKVAPCFPKMAFTPITPRMWKQAIRARKKSAAIGPDGVSRLDLLNMPPKCVDQMLKILQRIENGESWPSAWMTGIIHALEKRAGASKVTDFRPITIFSLAYRLWGSIRARQILTHLATNAPEELIGNRPRRETAHVWYVVSSLVECSLSVEEPLVGAVADITKCFNTLPRVPIFTLARLVGIPVPICQAWHRALGQMERRFSVSGCIGRSLLSSCGFPEGDALSVCAMFLVNLAQNAYMSQCRIDIRAWSFVDDWQLTGTKPTAILEGMRHVEEFTLMLDLSLDEEKSFCWATRAEDRLFLRQQGKVVKLGVRNLGGHVSYCKLATNFTVQTRIRELETFWAMLRRSAAPMYQKVIALAVVAWPRALHAVAGVSLAGDIFQSLRTRAMQSLGHHQKGASPILTLSCVYHPRADPGYYAVLVTIKMFRKLCIPDVAFALLNGMANDPLKQHRYGPCGALLLRLNDISWSWDSDGWMCDHEGIRIHLLHSPLQSLLNRVRQAWVARVGSLVYIRDGFAGVATVDSAFTVHRMPKMEQGKASLLRTTLNGTFYTRDKQFASGKFVDKQCPFCECQDSLFHRHWECVRFQSSRSMISKQVFSQLHCLPECTIQHGWIQEPVGLSFFRHQLTNLPDCTGDFFCTYSDKQDMHLFTDGGCLRPESPQLRVATWGCCVADLTHDSFKPVAQGPVPGLSQTALRGELYACGAAFRFGLHTKVPFWIWTDNQLVHDYLTSLDSGEVFVDCMDNDHDLKHWIRDLWRTARRQSLFCRVMKVRSHMDLQQFSNEVERWAIRGNTAADEAATVARTGYTREFQQVWEHLCQYYDFFTKVRDELHDHFIRIGEAATASKSDLRDQEARRWAEFEGTEAPEVSTAELDLMDLPPEWPLDEQPSFGGCEVTIFSWLQQLLSPDDGVTKVEQWISMYHLLLDFQRSTGIVGYKRNSETKSWQVITSWEAAQDYSCCEVTKNFTTLIRSLCGLIGARWGPIPQRPSGGVFKRWIRCARLRVSVERFQSIDVWLAVHKVVAVQHIGRAFQNLPPFIEA